MTQQARLALFGCGAAGKIHARAMQDSTSARLCAVVDQDVRAARALGEKCGVMWTVDVDRILDDRAIDVVSIAVPHHAHFDLAARAARAGKHVLLEKPFTTSCSEAAELVRICDEARVIIMPWLERRYLPYVDHAREIVASGELGKLVYTRVSTLGYKPRAYWQYGMRLEEYPSSWRSNRATSGGGVLIMNAVHQIDLMSHITQLNATRAFASIATLLHEVEVEDMAVVNLLYEGGAMGVVEASCCTYGTNQFPIERPADMVMGTDGNLQLGDHMRCVDRIRHVRKLDFAQTTVTELKTKQLENFCAHLRDGTDLRCRPIDAIKTLAIVEAAYRSAETHAPVAVASI